MRQNGWKRALALMLSLALIFGLLPMGQDSGLVARAAGDEVVAAIYNGEMPAQKEGIADYDETVAGGGPVELVFTTHDKLDTDRMADTRNQWTGFETTGASPWRGTAPDGQNYLKRIVKVTFETKVKPTSCADYFNGMAELREIVGMAEYLDTSLATSMNYMFNLCSKLDTIDVSKFNTSKVTGMAYMFRECQAVRTLDVSGFDTSRCTTMALMFQGCVKLTGLDISHFDTWQVTNFDNFMRQTVSQDKAQLAWTALDTSRADNIGGLTGVYENQVALDPSTTWDLSSFDTSRVRRGGTIFDTLKQITTIYVSDAFQTETTAIPSKERSWGAAFYQGGSLVTGGEGSRSNAFRVDKGTSAPGAFTYAYHTHAVLVDLGNGTYRMELRRANVLPLDIDGDGDADYPRTYENVVNAGEIDLGWGFEAKGAVAPWQVDAYRDKIVQIDIQDPIRPVNVSGWFRNMTNLETITGMENFITSAVEDFSHLFHGCAKLRDLDVTHMNVLNALDMSYMFAGCSSLTELELLNHYTHKLTGADEIRLAWDTALVRDMSHMFEGCSALHTLVTSGKDRDGRAIAISTANVTDMSCMFKGCSALDDPDLSMFSTVKVSSENPYKEGTTGSMVSMFEGIGARTLDVSSFNTANVTDMRNMFANAVNLKTILASGNFVTFGLADGGGVGMFTGDTALVGGRGTAYNEAETDSSKATRAGYFTNGGQDAYALLYTDGSLVFQLGGQPDPRKELVEKWTGFEDNDATVDNSWRGRIAQVKTVTFLDEIVPRSTANWFNGGVNITSLDLTNLNTSVCRDMDSMFKDCAAVTSLNVGAFDTSHVTDMGHMFDGMTNLTSLSVTNFKTQNVTDMSYMFAGLAQITSLNLNNITNDVSVGYVNTPWFDTGKVTNMEHMFDGCTRLGSLSLVYFDTANVTNMDSMFKGLATAATIDVTSFDTSKVTNMTSMFQGDQRLATIWANKSFTTGAVTASGNMFEGCVKLKGFYGTVYSAAMVDKTYARPEGAECRNYTVTVEATEYREAYESDRTEWTVATPGYFTQPPYNIFYEKDGVGTLVVQRGNTVDAGMGTVMTCANGQPAVFRGAAPYAERTSANQGLSSAKWNTVTTARVVDLLRETSYVSMFDSLSKLTAVEGLSNLDMSECTSIGRMFAGTDANLVVDGSSWDMSKVKSMSLTFSYTGVSVKGYENWDVSSLTDMYGTFLSTKNMPYIDLSRWRPDNLTSLYYTFCDCKAKVVDLRGWSLEKVNHFQETFRSCWQLEYIYVSPSVELPTTGVTYKKDTFLYCTSLKGKDGTKIYDSSKTTGDYLKPIEKGGYLTVVEDSGPAYKLEGDVLTISRDLAGGTRFDEKAAASAAPWDGIDKTAVTKVVIGDTIYPVSTAHWFDGMVNLTAIEGLDKLETFTTTDMSYMFNDCGKLEKIDLSKFDTSNVTNMDYMFADTKADLDVGYLSTAKLERAAHMFDGAKGDINLVAEQAAEKADGSATRSQVARFEGKLLTNMESMFANTVATELAAWKLNVSNVTNMKDLFRGSHFATLDLSGWDTQAKAGELDMSGLFAEANVAKAYKGDNFVIPAGTAEADLFQGNVGAQTFELPDVTVGGLTLDEKNYFYNAETISGVSYPARTVSGLDNTAEAAKVGHPANAVWDPNTKTLTLNDISVSGYNGPAIRFNVPEAVTVVANGVHNSLGLNAPKGTPGNICAKGDLTIKGAAAGSQSGRLSVGGSNDVPGIVVVKEGGSLTVEDIALAVSGQPGLKVDGAGATSVNITNVTLSTSGTQGVALSEKAADASLTVTDSAWTHSGGRYLVNGAPVDGTVATNETVTIVRSTVNAANIGSETGGIVLQGAGSNRLIVDDHSKVYVSPKSTSGTDASSQKMVVVGTANCTGETELTVKNNSVLNVGGGTESPVTLEGSSAALKVEDSDLAATSNSEETPAIVVPASAEVTATQGSTVTTASPVGGIGTDAGKTVTLDNQGATVTEIRAAGVEIDSRKNNVNVKATDGEKVEVKVTNATVETNTETGEKTVTTSTTTVESTGDLSVAGANGISASRGSEVSTNTATQTATTDSSGQTTTTTTTSGSSFTASNKGATLANDGTATGVDTSVPVTVTSTDENGNTTSTTVTIQETETGSGGSIGAGGAVAVKPDTTVEVTNTTPSGTTTTTTVTAGEGSNTGTGIVVKQDTNVTVTTEKTNPDGSTTTVETTVTPKPGSTVATGSGQESKLDVAPETEVKTESTTTTQTSDGKTQTTTTTTSFETPAEGGGDSKLDLSTGSATVPGGTPVKTEVTTETKGEGGVSEGSTTTTTTVESEGDLTLNTTTGGVTTQPGDKVTVETQVTETPASGEPTVKDPVKTELITPTGSEGLDIDTTGKSDIVVPSGTTVTPIEKGEGGIETPGKPQIAEGTGTVDPTVKPAEGEEVIKKPELVNMDPATEGTEPTTKTLRYTLSDAAESDPKLEVVLSRDFVLEKFKVTDANQFTLKVGEVAPENAGSNVSSIIRSAKKEAASLYDLSLLLNGVPQNQFKNENITNKDERNTVTVRLPMSAAAAADPTGYKIYCVNIATRKLEPMNATAENGVWTFTTTHFSLYGEFRSATNEEVFGFRFVVDAPSGGHAAWNQVDGDGKYTTVTGKIYATTDVANRSVKGWRVTLNVPSDVEAALEPVNNSCMITNPEVNTWNNADSVFPLTAQNTDVAPYCAPIAKVTLKVPAFEETEKRSFTVGFQAGAENNLVGSGGNEGARVDVEETELQGADVTVYNLKVTFKPGVHRLNGVTGKDYEVSVRYKEAGLVERKNGAAKPTAVTAPTLDLADGVSFANNEKQWQKEGDPGDRRSFAEINGDATITQSLVFVPGVISADDAVDVTFQVDGKQVKLKGTPNLKYVKAVPAAYTYKEAIEAMEKEELLVVEGDGVRYDGVEWYLPGESTPISDGKLAEALPASGSIILIAKPKAKENGLTVTVKYDSTKSQFTPGAGLTATETENVYTATSGEDIKFKVANVDNSNSVVSSVTYRVGEDPAMQLAETASTEDLTIAGAAATNDISISIKTAEFITVTVKNGTNTAFKESGETEKVYYAIPGRMGLYESLDDLRKANKVETSVTAAGLFTANAGYRLGKLPLGSGNLTEASWALEREAGETISELDLTRKLFGTENVTLVPTVTETVEVSFAQPAVGGTLTTTLPGNKRTVDVGTTYGELLKEVADSLTVTPAAGYVFEDQWSVDETTAVELTAAVNAAVTLKPLFQPRTYTLSVNEVSVSGTPVVSYVVTAYPNATDAAATVILDGSDGNASTPVAHKKEVTVKITNSDSSTKKFQSIGINVGGQSVLFENDPANLAESTYTHTIPAEQVVGDITVEVHVASFVNIKLVVDADADGNQGGTLTDGGAEYTKSYPLGAKIEGGDFGITAKPGYVLKEDYDPADAALGNYAEFKDVLGTSASESKVYHIQFTPGTFPIAAVRPDVEGVPEQVGELKKAEDKTPLTEVTFDPTGADDVTFTLTPEPGEIVLEITATIEPDGADPVEEKLTPNAETGVYTLEGEKVTGPVTLNYKTVKGTFRLIPEGAYMGAKRGHQIAVLETIELEKGAYTLNVANDGRYTAADGYDESNKTITLHWVEAYQGYAAQVWGKETVASLSAKLARNATQEPAKRVVSGNANEDDKIDESDAGIVHSVLMYLHGYDSAEEARRGDKGDQVPNDLKLTLTPYQRLCLDANGDGKVTSADIDMILQRKKQNAAKP